MSDWCPIAKEYDPLKAGSIDGTDVEPHDRAIWRAMGARYKPNKGVVGDPLLTLFVARLNPQTTEEKLHDVFSKYGDIKRLRLVRDIVTGFSKRYAFVEFKEERARSRACREANKLLVDQHEVFVDFEQERTLTGWVPRRLGGGLGGKKESGQLRFGGKDRPFRKPLNFFGTVAAQQWEGDGGRGGRGGGRHGARGRQDWYRSRETDRGARGRRDYRDREDYRDRDRKDYRDRDRGDYRDRDREDYRDRDRKDYRDRDRGDYRDRDREDYRDRRDYRDREDSRDRDRENYRDRDRENYRDREDSRDRDRENYRDRRDYRDREDSRDRDREDYRDRDREDYRDRRDYRDREDSRDRDSEDSRDRDREDSRDRDREDYRDRDRR